MKHNIKKQETDHPPSHALLMKQAPMSSILPKVNPKWKRRVTDLETSFQSNGIKCEVCLEETSRYTCPSCSIHYCSVDCYKRHGYSCTEVFYKKQVVSSMEIETKLDREKIISILNRFHEEQAENVAYEGVLNKDELGSLQQALDEGKDVHLSPALQVAFDRDLRSGKLSDLVNRWSPWWQNDLVRDESELGGTESSQLDDNFSLDDRLLEIPLFSNLCSKGPPNCLPWNLVSMLRAILLVLRLYSGRDNAILCCLDAFETMVSSCLVLKDDFRYDSLPEVLMNKSDDFLHQDLCAILSNRRHIAHALFDGIDIVKATESEFEEKSNRRNARRIRKKIEFYLSWSRSVDLGILAEDVTDWQNEWRLEETPVEEIILPK